MNRPIFAVMGAITAVHPAAALITTITDAITSAREGLDALKALKNIATPDIHDRAVREVLERAIDGVLSVGANTLLRRINRIPGGRRLVGLLADTGYVGEFATSFVLERSGLFSEVSSALRNRSDNGIDIVALTKGSKPEAVIFEVKTSARAGQRWLPLSPAQNRGATSFGLSRAQAGLYWGGEAAQLSRAVTASAAQHNGQLRGYVFQISQFGSRTMAVESYRWIPNLNSLAIRRGAR